MKITKHLEWDMGHRVPNHKSKCRNLHGHRYFADITLEGGIVLDEGVSEEGMVMDFSDIKKIANELIDIELDHGCMLHESDVELIELFQKLGFKLVVVPFIPTAENIAKALFDQLQPKFLDTFGNGLRLTKIVIWETPTSSAEYSITN